MRKFIYFVLILVASSDAAKILAYFPLASISHQVVFRPLVQELAKRGHEVVTITTDPVFPKGQAPVNLTEVDVHDISYNLWIESFTSTEVEIPYGSVRDWNKQAPGIYDMIVRMVEKQLMTEQVRAVIDQSNNYDLLILEAGVFGALALTHFFKVPVIQISSFGPQKFNLESVGAPLHIFRQPLPIQHRIKPLGVWEKLYELLVYYEIDGIVSICERKFDVMLKKVFGPEIPDVKELKNNVDMIFLNVHSLWELNRPMPPNVVFTGGLHQVSPKDLPEELKSYLDSSKNGVIYVSFGTNVDPSLFPAHRIEVLVNTFSKLPYDILWKWNKDELPGRSSNMKISKWLPQSDLLRHPKIKVFVTQAGLQSTDEAITAGVPLIGIPMIGDQWYNAELYVYHKIGQRVDLPEATEESLLNAINNVINDDRYRKNIAKLRAVMRDQVQSPLERAVWWTEYVLRHGGAKHLRSPLANLSWAEYLELDLVLVIVAAFLSILLVSLVILYSLYKFVRRHFNKKSKLKRN